MPEFSISTSWHVKRNFIFILRLRSPMYGLACSDEPMGVAWHYQDSLPWWAQHQGRKEDTKKDTFKNMKQHNNSLADNLNGVYGMQ